MWYVIRDKVLHIEQAFFRTSCGLSVKFEDKKFVIGDIDPDTTVCPICLMSELDYLRSGVNLLEDEARR